MYVCVCVCVCRVSCCVCLCVGRCYFIVVIRVFFYLGNFQIEELVEAVVLPITHAERFKEIGIEPPKGMCLHHI